MTIDAHQHFWIYDATKDAWITDKMKNLQKDFLPKDLEPILKENKIEGCVAVQASQSEIETQFLLELSNQYNFIKGVIGWVDLCSTKIGKRLEHYSKFGIIKGFRHIVQAEPENFMMRKDFMNGISMLQEYNFTYDVLVYAHQLPDAISLVEKFPEQKFVLDHLGKPPIKTKEIEEWSGNIKRLSTSENVFCKISGMVTQADWMNWSYADFVPYLDVITSSFGLDRLMYGSDWPVCNITAKYREQLAPVQKYYHHLDVNLQNKVFGKNAISFYNLTV